LDEIHHAGDARSWGDAVREAFEPATRRLALTGTPFRSDVNPIPFVTYQPGGDGIRRSAPDYTYGYGHALRDHVVRPVIFLVYGGEMRWRSSAGDEIAAALGEPMTRELAAQAWRTALDPHGNWIPQVLAAADRRLTEVRRHMPDAGAMVVASDHRSARAYAARLRAITGEPPAVVLSDDPGASARIEEFTRSQQRWMVAVRMVSEGVDVPRLAVGVYATSVCTPLFFAQAVGRFVRARRRGETASVFLPSIPALLGYAAELEVERDHALDRPVGESDPDAEWEAAGRTRTEAGEQERLGFQPLAAEAVFDRVLFDGGEFGSRAEMGSAEELDFIGLPGLLEPAQVTELLQRRQAAQLASKPRAATAATQPAGPVPAYRELRELRRELNGLVGGWHRRTGQPHPVIHAELRRACGGPRIAQATADQLLARIERIRTWATRA
jgi:superfamily II DNA or RNA helicase